MRETFWSKEGRFKRCGPPVDSDDDEYAQISTVSEHGVQSANQPISHPSILDDERSSSTSSHADRPTKRFANDAASLSTHSGPSMSPSISSLTDDHSTESRLHSLESENHGLKTRLAEVENSMQSMKEMMLGVQRMMTSLAVRVKKHEAKENSLRRVLCSCHDSHIDYSGDSIMKDILSSRATVSSNQPHDGPILPNGTFATKRPLLSQDSLELQPTVKQCDVVQKPPETYLGTLLADPLDSLFKSPLFQDYPSKFSSQHNGSTFSGALEDGLAFWENPEVLNAEPTEESGYSSQHSISDGPEPESYALNIIEPNIDTETAGVGGEQNEVNYPGISQLVMDRDTETTWKSGYGAIFEHLSSPIDISAESLIFDDFLTDTAAELGDCIDVGSS